MRQHRLCVCISKEKWPLADKAKRRHLYRAGMKASKSPLYCILIIERTVNIGAGCMTISVTRRRESMSISP